MAWYNPISWFRPEKVTVTPTPPKTQEPVRAVDVGTPTQERTGGYTVRGGSGSRGGGGTISSVQGITPSQAESIEKTTAGIGTPATLPQQAPIPTPQQIVVAKQQGVSPQQIAISQQSAQQQQLSQLATARQQRQLRVQPPTPEQRRRIEVAGTTQIPQRQFLQADIKEAQFQSGQASAADLLLGGGTPSREYATGTRIREDFGQVESQVYAPGTIYEVQTDTFTPSGITTRIPITKTYTVGEDWSSRPSTATEIKQLQDYSKAIAYEQTALKSRPSDISIWYGEQKGRYKRFAAEPFYDKEATQQLFGESKAGKFTGGVVTGFIPSTKGGVVTTGIITAATAGAGFAFKGISYGVSRIPAIGKYASTAVKGTEIGVGAYLGGSYALSTATKLEYAKDWTQRGEIIGTSAREVGAGVTGYRLGVKGFDITKGYLTTRGRPYNIEIPTGEYPTAPVKEQLSLFKKNIYPELGKKPGAFHTTGERFWKTGEITPQIGTSELPGLYGSTKISTPFARITGSSVSRAKWIPTMRELFTTEGSPGVAYLQPKGFRYSPAKPGKWYYPAKPGYADVPGIKTEIEAIFRPEAGSYIIDSSKYYTTIKGVRVPLDVFKYDPSASGIVSTTGGVNLYGGRTSYSPYVESAIFTPEAGVSTAIKDYSKSVSYQPSSYTPSYTSVTSPSTTSLISYSKSPTSSGVNSYIKSSSKKSYAPSVSKIVSSVKPSSSKEVSSFISSVVSKSYKSPVSYARPSYKQPYYPSYPKPIKPARVIAPFKLKPAKQPTGLRGGFQVFGRRFGKFQLVGIGKTPTEAVGIGKSWARKTLGVTFKIPKFKGTKVTGFKTKKEKDSLVFIEPRGQRIKKGTKEIPEIQYWKKVKSPVQRIYYKKKKKNGDDYGFVSV